MEPSSNGQAQRPAACAPAPDDSNPTRCGLTDVAKAAGMDRETLVSLMEHHGMLELVFHGGRQRRRLLTDQALRADLGLNYQPAPPLGKKRRCSPPRPAFPVLYAHRVSDILWCLDLPGIAAMAHAQEGKKAKLQWLLARHPYLPNAEVARIAGYSMRGIDKARAGTATEDEAPAARSTMMQGYARRLMSRRPLPLAAAA